VVAWFSGFARSMAAHVLLLEPPGLVDDALEDPADRRSVEGGGRELPQALGQTTFAVRIVHLEVMLPLQVADLQDDSDALGDELEDLTVDAIDVLTEVLEFGEGHGCAW
jgi:hypothetical protein